MTDSIPVAVHPVQIKPDLHRRDNKPVAPQVVTMRAYEVYRHLYHEQTALVSGACRGGFGIGELVAFLYARSFPKSEWSARVDEAFRGMRL